LNKVEKPTSNGGAMSAIESSGNIPHKGKVPPDKGKVPPDKGKVPPDKGKVPPDKGKGSGGAQAILGSVTDGAACVVLRASVETFGPAGDAELSFHVKWPGTTLAAAEGSAEASTDGQDSDGGGMDASGNLYLPATHSVPTKRG
jgi:hypothetical protein